MRAFKAVVYSEAEDERISTREATFETAKLAGVESLINFNLVLGSFCESCRGRFLRVRARRTWSLVLVRVVVRPGRLWACAEVGDALHAVADLCAAVDGRRRTFHRPFIVVNEKT